jgi:DNA-binding CsgD family transcriptional regulator
VRLTEQEWLVAQKVCTRAQLRVLRLYRQGMSKRAIARLLRIAPSSVRDHLDAAARRIDAVLEDSAA